MKRETQNILLVLLGGALLKIALNGTYLRYVKPSQQYWLIAAGAIMVLLAFVSIGRDIIASRKPAEVSGEVHDHEHHHGFQSHSTWLLVLPVLAVFLAPPALGEDAVNRSMGRTPPPPSSETYGFAPLPQGDVIDSRLKDFVERAAWDKSGSLNDRTVRLSGFIVHRDNATFIARLAIGCCAADAYPVKVRLEGNGLDTLPGDTWMSAMLRYKPGTATKETLYVPTATVTHIEPIAEPKDPYEY